MRPRFSLIRWSRVRAPPAPLVFVKSLVSGYMTLAGGHRERRFTAGDGARGLRRNSLDLERCIGQPGPPGGPVVDVHAAPLGLHQTPPGATASGDDSPSTRSIRPPQPGRKLHTSPASELNSSETSLTRTGSARRFKPQTQFPRPPGHRRGRPPPANSTPARTCPRRATSLACHQSCHTC